MIQKCTFDKVRDIQDHVPSLATDLNKAIETNTVQDTGVVADFNSIEEPNSITGRVSDAFEAIDALVPVDSDIVYKNPVATDEPSEPQQIEIHD